MRKKELKTQNEKNENQHKQKILLNVSKLKNSKKQIAIKSIAILLMILLMMILYIALIALTGDKTYKTIERISAKISNVKAETGVYGTCRWSIDNNGNMIIMPETGTQGTLPDIESPYKIPWYPNKDEIKTVSFQGTIYAGKSVLGLFWACSNLISIDFTGFNTNNVTSMQSMFYNCTSLTNINFTNFNTSNVTSMESMFYNCASLTNIDVSKFDTSKVTTMQNMFRGCASLEKLDLSNFNTSQVTTMQSMFDACANLKDLDLSNFDTTLTTRLDSMYNSAGITKIKIGEKYNLKTNLQSTGGGCFARGTWTRLEDGKKYSVVEICTNSTEGKAAGTYVKQSDISNELAIDFPVTYRIEALNEISEFSTDRSDIFQLMEEQNAVIANIPSATTSKYTVPGKIELTFKNKVTDENHNKYDLKMTIDKIEIYDLNISQNLIGEIIRIDKNIVLLNSYFYSNLEDFKSDKHVTVYSDNKYDITMQILKDGTPVEGSYIFSVFDLDIASARDTDAAITDVNGNGYGERSEGINILEGMDTSTLKCSSNTFLRDIGNYKIRGSRVDNESEFSEFLIKTDAKYAKFQRTAPGGAGTYIFSYYQPQSVPIIKQNEKGENLAGAKLGIYYIDGETKVKEWVSGDTAEEVFLMPGAYILKEIEAPAGYEKAEDIEFYIDADSIICNGEQIENIIMVNQAKMSSIVVKYIDIDTGQEIADRVIKEGKVWDKYDVTGDKKDIERYTLVKEPEEKIGIYTEEVQEIIYYYRLKDPSITTPVLTKESTTQKVVNIDQAIDYTINYKTTIDEYKGKVTVTIVDTLPYKIDEQKSNIAGGTYNPTEKTITWIETIEKLDTYTTGKEEINIAKEINLTYKEIDTTKNTIENTVTGTINLETPEKEETVEKIKEIPTEYFVNIEVTKQWEDNNDEAKKRPKGIDIVIKNGTEEVGRQEANIANNWKVTFENLPKYDEVGKEIVYTVTEEEKTEGDLKFYTKGTAIGSIESGYTIKNTFTLPEEKISVKVTKNWEDTEEQKDKRPEKVTLVLKSNSTEVAEQRKEITTTEDITAVTFNNLQKYDSKGNEIIYTATEEGNNKFYTVEETTGSMIDGYTITNKFVRPEETIDLTVNKVWVDNETQAQRRPASIVINVKAENADGKTAEDIIDTETLDTATQNSYIFTNLPKYNSNGDEIIYKVEEAEANAGDLHFYQKTEGKVINVDGEENKKQATITNTFTRPEDKIEIKVNKNWEDSQDVYKKRPVSIKLQVKVPEIEETTGEETDKVVKEQIVTKEDNWSYTFTNLDKYDANAKEIEYKIDEAEIIDGDLFHYTKEIGELEETSEEGNKEGTIKNKMTKIPGKVEVKYVDKASKEEISDPVEKEGIVGEKFDITVDKKEIPGYTLIEEPKELTGTYTEEKQEKIYYYAKNTKVIVKYLEKETNKTLTEEPQYEIIGYEGKEYTTEKKEIEGYEFVEATDNTEGKMTKEPIEVIYYYAQKTKAKVQHIDRETGEILKEEIKNGKVGDIFETYSEDFEGYVLVESPEEPDIIMDKTGEQVVKYYYARISAGVIEKHIDEITGELIYSEEHKGNEGDYYNIASKTFEGYDLITQDSEGNSKLPQNAEGKMTQDLIEVKYYYIKKVKVIVKYIEKDTQTKLAEEEIIEGHENDSYETKEKDIKGYNLVEKPENEKGNMTVIKNPDGTYNTEIEVIYYYKKQAGGVIENHIDITTDKILATKVHQGNVGDEYDIPSKEFEGYDLVIEDKEGNNRLPENAKGTMTEKEIEVNYYYLRQTKIKIEYIDKLTGEKIKEEEIKGHVGDKYETKEKEFDGYELVEKPSNSTGEMKEEEIIIRYYYKRKAEVEIKYIEKDTGYEIKEKETIEGYVGDKYETKEKEIKYYKLVGKTENDKGEMKKDKITVIYYYEKQIFNLGIDKWVSNVNINGISQGAQNINNKDEIYKVDIHRNKIETTEIKITYKIRVTNKGEIEGTVGEILEIIPTGYSYHQEDNKIYWEERKEGLVTDALKEETIKAGENKEIEIVLRWNKGEDNFGQKDNLVLLNKINNPAGYEDIDKTDNSSSSSMIITIATGLDRNDRIIVGGIIQIVLIISIIGLLMTKQKKKENNK